jgi:hypothetical protein
MKKAIKIFLRITFCSLFWLFQYCFAYAQVPSFSIDKKSILIGEQISYEILLPYNKGGKALVFIPDSIPHFDIVQKKNIDTTSISGKLFLKQKIVFTSFDSGVFSFPNINYSINNVQGTLDSFAITVGYMPTDVSNEPRDIKSIIEVSTVNDFWIYAGILFLVVLLGAYFAYKYFNKKKVLFLPTEKNDPYSIAMLALVELQKLNTDKVIGVKDFHIKLSAIFKKYCSKISFQNFNSFTATEVLSNLKSFEINAQTALEAKEAFKTGDATKFAKYNPSFLENETSLSYIKNTISEIEQSRNKPL